MTRTIVRGGQRMGPVFWLSMAVALLLMLISLVRHAAADPPPGTTPPCDSVDFNNDGVFPDTQDLEDFRTVFGGGACPTGNCNDIDFNNDGLFPDTADIDAFVRVLAGGPCLEPAGPAWQDYRGGASRRVYVSSSMGSDASDGTEAHPRRTIPQGFSLLLAGTGDGLFLKRGDVFPEYIGEPGGGAWNKSGMRADRPLWVGAYGDRALPRPVVNGIGGTAALRYQSGGGVSFVAVDSIDFQWVTGSPRNGISYWSVGSGLLIQNCRVQGFEGGISLESNAATWTTGLTGVVIRGCEILDSTPRGSHSQGLYVDRASGICEWTIVDRCGRLQSGDGTIFNHGAYITSPTTGWAFEHCLVARNSATGLQLRAQDTSARDCLVLDNPLGITTGHADILLKQDRRADGTLVTLWENKFPEWGWRGEVARNLIVGGGDICPTKTGPDRQPRGMPIGLGFVAGGRFTDNVIMQVTGGDPWTWNTGGLTTAWAVTGNAVFAPQGRLWHDDGQQVPRPPYGPNAFHDGTAPPQGATFDDFLLSLGYTSRDAYLTAARAAWSREGWDWRFSPDTAYRFVRGRLGSTP